MISFTFGYKTWIFLNWIHLLGSKNSKSQQCFGGPPHVVLETSESSMVQSIWRRVPWSLVHTGHHDVVTVEVSMFSWRQQKLVSTWGSRTVSNPDSHCASCPVCWHVAQPAPSEKEPLSWVLWASEFWVLTAHGNCKTSLLWDFSLWRMLWTSEFPGLATPFKLQALDLIFIHLKPLIKSSSTSLTPKMVLYSFE